MTDSKDTQEEKPQLNSVEDWYKMLDRTRCLGLDMLSMEGGSCYNLVTKSWFVVGKLMMEQNYSPNLIKGSGNNVMIKCTELKKDEGTWQPIYLKCTSELKLLNCSAINFTQTYYVIPCPKEGQEPLESYECRVKGTEDPKNMKMCCPAEVLKNVSLKDTEEEPRGQNEEQPSSTEAIRMERLEEGEDGDRATPGM